MRGVLSLILFLEMLLVGALDANLYSGTGRIDPCARNLSNLYPFGAAHGDSIAPKCDDCSFSSGFA